MRLMKAHTTMSHAALLSATTAQVCRCWEGSGSSARPRVTPHSALGLRGACAPVQVQARFVPDVKLLDTQIAVLLEKEYLARVQGGYTYVA